MPSYKPDQAVNTAQISGLVAGSPVSKYDQGKFWDGCSYEDIVFLDETEKRRNLYVDCSYSHNFKIRGLTYMDDKRKVDAGSPICKMIMLEIFEAAPDDNGRIDHICSRGLVKERVRILNSLPGNPFVLVLNIQIPGDPPVSGSSLGVVSRYIIRV
jgi:hypothetical protein